MKVSPESNEKDARSRRKTYREHSGGLLLNATSIITGTSKDSEDDIIVAKRLKSRPSLKQLEVRLYLRYYDNTVIID